MKQESDSFQEEIIASTDTLQRLCGYYVPLADDNTIPNDMKDALLQDAARLLAGQALQTEDPSDDPSATPLDNT